MNVTEKDVFRLIARESHKKKIWLRTVQSILLEQTGKMVPIDSLQSFKKRFDYLHDIKYKKQLKKAEVAEDGSDEPLFPDESGARGDPDPDYSCASLGPASLGSSDGNGGSGRIRRYFSLFLFFT